MATKMKDYEIEAIYTDRKVFKVKAHNRQEAISKASKHCEDRGIEVTHFKVPFKAGD